MPRRTDLRKILVLGAGPIVIGQACEFDYSGTQGCKALREEGYEVVLVNSNPATIMTDPELADRTYVEPLIPEVLEAILERERPDALLPTLGGQTALNLAMELDSRGILDRYGVELIGAKAETIARAEDRALFKESMEAVGLDLPLSETVTSWDEASQLLERIGLPLVVRPSFTLGGTGGGIARTAEEARSLVEQGLAASPIGQVLVEEGLVGWKEFELEVMRDGRDNVVIVCTIENLDPLGVHTGDSWTVAPALTLADHDYQLMRDAAIRAIRAIGVDTGGANVQFGVNPRTGRMVMIEINPRVSRSSALASKATGFPIARLAAKLAVGYHLDELRNTITGTTACFEPTIDYIVTKAPRFDFEKFGDPVGLLGTSMRAVGEVMAIGRTFKESLHKAIVSLEIGATGLLHGPGDDLEARLELPTAGRLFAMGRALEAGMAPAEVARRTGVDPFFVSELAGLVAADRALAAQAPTFAGAAANLAIADGPAAPALALAPEAVETLREAKRMGFPDARLAHLWQLEERQVRALRQAHGIVPTYKQVDTCGAEFAAETPYVYSCYELEDECPPTDRERVVVLGGGPNRIGQGIEFDACCVHAAQALKAAGVEAIMVNCNPETISTDHDTSDRLYFEPLTLEHVLNVVERERPRGVIVSFGGQTPLKLARELEAAGVPLLGTPTASIHRAEDRGQFGALLDSLGLEAPAWGLAHSEDEALAIAGRLGYPVLSRPSYVLGGRAMAIAHGPEELRGFLAPAFAASASVLIDRFLGDALEVDVDALFDGTTCRILGVMEHLEEAGVHSGDSTCSLPPHTLPAATVRRLEEITGSLARALEVRGPLNLQFALQGDAIHVLEVNPRASRTLPFVAKATGVAWARVATRVMLGDRLEAMDLPAPPADTWAVKAPVFPFARFPGSRPVLGPEMRSTGEAMGIGRSFGEAHARALLGSGVPLPATGSTALWLAPPGADADLREALVARGVTVVDGSGEGAAGPEGADALARDLRAGRFTWVVAPASVGTADGWDDLRRLAAGRRVPWFTHRGGVRALLAALDHIRTRTGWTLTALQELPRMTVEVRS